MFQMIGAGPTWSDRDLTRWRFAVGRAWPQLSRMSAGQAAAPDEPSRLPEGASQPIHALRVPGVHALRV